MKIIGILAPNGGEKIAAALKRIFAACKKRVACVRGVHGLADELASLESLGTEYCILSLKPGRTPQFVDILILDSAMGRAGVLYAALKCISPATRLLYNADRRSMPRIEHPNAVDYGLSRGAAVTVSSMDAGGDGDSVVFCMQRPIRTISDAPAEAGEVRLEGCGRDMSGLLAAVSCGFLCGIFTENHMKI